MSVLLGDGLERARWQWQPTTTAHDPNPPITLENPAGGPLGGTVNQASETDSAQAIARIKIRAIGQSAETDAAQPIGRTKRRTLGQVVETDEALPITGSLVGGGLGGTVNQATETDTAQTVGRTKARALGQPTTTDAAQPITRTKSRTLGIATETDTAQTVAGSGGATVGTTATPAASTSTAPLAYIGIPDTFPAEWAEEEQILTLLLAAD